MLRCWRRIWQPLNHLYTTCGLLDEVYLTKDRYPEVKRGDYAVLNDSHIQFFERTLTKNRVLTDPSEVQGYNIDWLKMVCGYSRIVLKPKTTEEVAAILKYCNAEKLAVCPQGGNTGLVGGSVPVFDEVILSTSLMNKIIDIDDLAGTLVCQAGCVLESLDTALEERGLMMPLDLGAKGSCQIGGNISTCAGGLRVLRYGSMQANTLGLEAVTAVGGVVNCLNTLKKDNTGYHLKHLFVGSEGTLGVVTKVAIQCPHRPAAVSLAFLGLSTFDSVIATFRLARGMLSETLSSCEMMDADSLQRVVDVLGLRSPLSNFPFYMVIETSGSNKDHDEEKLNKFLETAMADGSVLDGTVTNKPSTMHTLWQLRERIAESLVKSSYCYKYDISLPLQHFYEIIHVMKMHLTGTEAKTICGFGHVGDSNLHLNVTAERFSQELLQQIEPFIFEWTSKHGGSISAEHGIGFKKTKFLKYAKSLEAIRLMRQIKHVMDPNGILNPYKVLPEEQSEHL